VSDWPKWRKAADTTLVSYVTPDAVEQLRRLGVNRYDLQRRGDRRAVIQAIYESLLRSDIRYAPEKYHPSEAVQEIRSPAEVLVRPGEGTCLDLALLFCGLCLGFDLLPLLIVLEGHALAAVSLRFGRQDHDADDRRPELSLFDDDMRLMDPNGLRRLVAEYEYLPVECTGFARSAVLATDFPEGLGRSDGLLTFDRAVDAGREQLDELSPRPLWKAFDVAQLHYSASISPQSFNSVEFDGPELAWDVRERYGPFLIAVPGHEIPTRWDRRQLEELRTLLSREYGASTDPTGRRALDVATALSHAIEAKTVLQGVGAAEIRLAKLRNIFSRAITWPEHDTSFDALLVEAALVSLNQRRHQVGDTLSPLARFILGVAFKLGVGVDDPAVAQWLRSTDHQLADARDYSSGRVTGDPPWLLIDLGPEPMLSQVGSVDPPAWPLEVSATLHTDGADPILMSLNGCEATEAGLTDLLRQLLRRSAEFIDSDQGLLVDLAAPRWLLDRGVESWPVVDVNGDLEPLLNDCQPRLRWSQRRRNEKLRRAVGQRAREAEWSKNGSVLCGAAAADLSNDAKLGDWQDKNHRRPFVVSGPCDGTNLDILGVMLKLGYPFMVWFPTGVTESQARGVAGAGRGVPPRSRPAALPEVIRRKLGPSCLPSIIWDDPDGREGYSLPTVRLQGPGGVRQP
jgi:hypothetical protein